MIEFLFDKISFTNPIVLSIILVLFVITFLSILKKIIKFGIVLFVLFIFFMIYSIYTEKDVFEEIDSIVNKTYEVIDKTISNFSKDIKEKTSNAIEEKINNVFDETLNLK